MRRIVRGRRGIHHGDVKVTPQWHQWLRQTRPDPPTVQEQHIDLIRQKQLKHNARLADERWAAKAKYIEKPKETDTAPPTMINKSDTTRSTPGQQPIPPTSGAESSSKGTISEAQTPISQNQLSQDDPWAKEKQRQQEAASNPGGTWQPETWTPGPRKR